jgi:hypothetical protein
MLIDVTTLDLRWPDIVPQEDSRPLGDPQDTGWSNAPGLYYERPTSEEPAFRPGAIAEEALG